MYAVGQEAAANESTKAEAATGCKDQRIGSWHGQLSVGVLIGRLVTRMSRF